jgi:hypothetical protein
MPPLARRIGTESHSIVLAIIQLTEVASTSILAGRHQIKTRHRSVSLVMAAFSGPPSSRPPFSVRPFSR